MRVFLSYTTADEDFAKQLGSHLSKRGCEVWDPSEQLFPGDNWSLKIGEALKQSKAMVVLLSPDSIKSEWVRREIEYAIGDRTTKEGCSLLLFDRQTTFPGFCASFKYFAPTTTPQKSASALQLL
jgi:hypothetical protein